MNKAHFNLKKASIFTLLAALCFSSMTLFVKLAAAKVSVDNIIFFRFAISFSYILVILGIRKLLKRKINLHTKHIFMHVFRAIFGIMAMSLLYTSLKYIPIVDANLLVMTNAFFIPVFAFFLGKKMDYKHLFAIIIGFIGVAFILKPTPGLFDPYSLFALFAGISISIALMLVRKLAKFDDHYVCMFYFFLITFLISGIYAVFHWEAPDLSTLLVLMGIGVFGSLYQEFLIRASSYASAKITSSLLYSTLIFSIIFDFVFFRYVPGGLSWIGIFLMIISSVLTLYVANFKKKSLIKK